MPAVSKAQQRFMGMVHAAQKGEEPASPEVAKVAKDMTKKSAKDFASTKHKGLPDHIDEAIHPEVFREFMQACNDAGLNSFQIFGMHVLVYILTLGATGVTILSALGIAQLAKDAKDTFNNWNAGRKLNPQKVKAIVKDFENKVNKLEGGRKKFFQGIINKMKRTNPENKSALVSINKDLEHYAQAYGIKEGSVTTKPEEPNSDDLYSALPSAAVPGVSAESTLPTPTNNILWKATGKVCEGRSMAERVKMYEKKGGGWRMGKSTDEQVYNNLKEFYQNEIKPRKEAKEFILKRRMGETKINEMSDEVGEQDGVDHEVSMARASLVNIGKACQDLLGKIGSQEKNLPGWIQDHITNSENYIMQASKGYHEIDDKLKANTFTGPTQLDQNGK